MRDRWTPTEDGTLGRNSLLFAEIVDRTGTQKLGTKIDEIRQRYKNTDGTKPLVPASFDEIIKLLDENLGLRATLDSVVGLQTLPGKPDKVKSWAEDYYSNNAAVISLAKSIRKFLKLLDDAQNRLATQVTLNQVVEFHRNINQLFDEIAGKKNSDPLESPKRS